MDVGVIVGVALVYIGLGVAVCRLVVRSMENPPGPIGAGCLILVWPFVALCLVVVAILAGLGWLGGGRN